jgi:DNA invertase Pin-like site-specific DNA recombinase
LKIHTGRLVFNVKSAFAEFERTQEGKAIARKQEDFREGRPKKFSKIDRTCVNTFRNFLI